MEKKKILLNTVKENQPISRTRIKEITNIRPGTITALVKDLKKENFLLEVGKEKSLRGRRQSLLKLNGEKYFALGLEFDALAHAASPSGSSFRLAKCGKDYCQNHQNSDS